MGIGAAVGVISAGASMYGTYQSGKQNAAAIAAQNAYNLEQAKIDAQWYNMRLEYSKELEAFSYKKLEYAYEQEAYGYKKWQTAIENQYAQKMYEAESLENKKKSALTDFNAQVEVAKIMNLGAREQAQNAIQETVRVGAANAEEVNRKLVKTTGKINATLSSGLAGGTAAERAAVAAFMERNNAVNQVDDKTKSSIIQTIAQKDKINNDMALKVGQSYRELQAIYKLEVSPWQQIMEPAPVFDEMEPLSPIQPVGATPAAVPSLSSGGLLAQSFSSGIGAFTTGYNVGNAFNSWFSSPSTSLGAAPMPGAWAGYGYDPISLF